MPDTVFASPRIAGSTLESISSRQLSRKAQRGRRLTVSNPGKAHLDARRGTLAGTGAFGLFGTLELGQVLLPLRLESRCARSCSSRDRGRGGSGGGSGSGRGGSCGRGRCSRRRGRWEVVGRRSNRGGCLILLLSLCLLWLAGRSGSSCRSDSGQSCWRSSCCRRRFHLVALVTRLVKRLSNRCVVHLDALSLCNTLDDVLLALLPRLLLALALRLGRRWRLRVADDLRWWRRGADVRRHDFLWLRHELLVPLLLLLFFLSLGKRLPLLPLLWLRDDVALLVALWRGSRLCLLGHWCRRDGWR